MNAEINADEFDYRSSRSNFYGYETVGENFSLRIEESSFIEEKTRPRQKDNSKSKKKSLERSEFIVRERQKMVALLRIFRDLSSVFRFGGIIVFALSLIQESYMFALVGLFSTIGFSLFYSQSKQFIVGNKSLST
ncbi:hypothetical protein [Granulosicoccus antarcticus]|uniref:Uncharacterized protein n=1 Tax=Granulosicoccus antarcticus IMCC3135 TaxID=1192854 RepID=A0A2Z2NMY5_9GAMM|nr:hypothetical protein [Granulosicoccus antarcticus]ASJ71088.1 hypothetical protein IMCC3135_04875 [Granulosicoccus antarcticus IMCC3135]